LASFAREIKEGCREIEKIRFGRAIADHYLIVRSKLAVFLATTITNSQQPAFT
jgi:hypothetical protein